MLNALILDLYAQNAALWDILRQLGVSEGQMRDSIIKQRARGEANVPPGILDLRMLEITRRTEVIEKI